MPVFQRPVDLDHLSPAKLWAALVPELRHEAARAFLEQSGADAAVKRSADAAIARALRFREASVRKLPVDKKAGYLARQVPIDDLMASGFLHSLHTEKRRPMLIAFLDALGVPHDNGVITVEEPPKPAEDAVVAGARKLFAEFPPEEVEVYLTTLVAVEPGTWPGVKQVLAERPKGA